MGAPGHVLAIDLGTSGPKVALVTADGSIVSSGFAPTALMLLSGTGAEQDPEDWWRAIGIATSAAMTDGGIDAAAVAAVSVTAQWSGTVALDDTGTPAGNAIIWMDARGRPHVDRLRGGPVTVQGYDPRKLRRWIRLTGGAPSASGKGPLAHIAFLRHERPETFAAVRTFLEPKDYLNYRLTGKRVASFDSIALHWVTDNRDPASVDYHPALLEYAGLTRSQLPELVPATEVIGGLTAEAAAHLGLLDGTPVVAGTPDLHSAAIGAGAVADFAGHLYLGTSSWLLCHVPFKKTDITHNMASLPAAVRGKYLVANEQETAGKALEWLGRILHPDEEQATVLARLNAAAAEAGPGSGGTIFTPWLYGERTPVEDARLRGGFFNHSLATGRADLVRSVFEGVAYNSRWLLHYVERFAGRVIDPIVAVGGGATSQLWCQIHADVLGRTVHQAEDPIMVNVRGAGLLAHVALGHIGWGDIRAAVPMAQTFAPDPATKPTYDRLYDAFRRIHKGNRRTYHALNR